MEQWQFSARKLLIKITFKRLHVLTTSFSLHVFNLLREKNETERLEGLDWPVYPAIRQPKVGPKSPSTLRRYFSIVIGWFGMDDANSTGCLEFRYGILAACTHTSNVRNNRNISFTNCLPVSCFKRSLQNRSFLRNHF